MTDMNMNMNMDNYMVIKGRVLRYPVQKASLLFEQTVVDNWFLGKLLEREATRRNQEKLFFKIVKEGGKEVSSFKATFREEDFYKVLVNIAETRNKKRVLYELIE